MKKTILAMVAATTVAAAPSASALMLQLSIGQGAMINPKGGPYNASTVTSSPMTTEILVGYHFRRWLTLDLGFLFAYDVLEPYYGSSCGGCGSAYYVGFRPGIHAFLNTRRLGLRPYLRAAFPIFYDNATSRTAVGILAGGGLEYRLGFLGVFGEIIISPFFNHDNQIPVEGRVGIAIHL